MVLQPLHAQLRYKVEDRVSILNHEWYACESCNHPS